MAREKFMLGGNSDFNLWLNDFRKTNAKHEARKAIIDDMERKLLLDGSLSYRDQCKLVTCITPTNGTGKMEGIPGCPDTNCLNNQFCNLRVANCHKLPDADPDDPFDGVAVCTLCYSAESENSYDPLCHTTEDNARILRNFNICEDAWATLSITALLDVVRGEMHGDSGNILQVENNIRIVRSHEQFDFTFWSKNLGHWANVFNRMGKPENMMFVASSTYINRVRMIPDDMIWFVDQIFTVYTKKYALEHGIIINCGQYEGVKRIDHKCRYCMRCYTEKHPGNEVGYINELLKGKGGK